MSISLVQLCQLGKDELNAKRERGELKPCHLWVSMKGAAKYQAAVAMGDVASEEDQQARFAVCLACTKRTQTHALHPNTWKHWCGNPIEEDRPNGKCGCLLGLTVDGVAVPGGKTAVASEACWSGEWAAVPRAQAATLP